MYGLGFLALLAAVLIAFFLFVKPDLSILAPRSTTASSSAPAASSAAKDICIASAKSAYRADVMMLDLSCPMGADSLPDSSCVQASSAGAASYAKYQQDVAGCVQ